MFKLSASLDTHACSRLRKSWTALATGFWGRSCYTKQHRQGFFSTYESEVAFHQRSEPRVASGLEIYHRRSNKQPGRNVGKWGANSVQWIAGLSFFVVCFVCRARKHHYLQQNLEPGDHRETLSPDSLRWCLLWSTAATGKICGLLPMGKACCTSALSCPETVQCAP